MKPISLCLLTVSAALASCAHQHVSGSFAIQAGAPVTFQVQTPSPTDVTIKLWNAGPDKARYERLDGHSSSGPIDEGWGYRYEDSEMRSFVMTFSTTTHALIGYDVESDRSVQVRVQK